MNFEEEEEEYNHQLCSPIFSIAVEKCDKFVVKKLSLHREMKTYPCLMVGWACRQTTLSATDPSITHTHLINPTFVTICYMGSGFPMCKVGIMEDFVGCHPCCITFIQ
jgi:hypothetical protein